MQYGVSELLLGGIEAVVRDIGMQDGPETLNRVWYPTIDPVLSLNQCSECSLCRHFGNFSTGNSLGTFRICLHCLHCLHFYLSSFTRKGK